MMVLMRAKSMVTAMFCCSYLLFFYLLGGDEPWLSLFLTIAFNEASSYTRKRYATIQPWTCDHDATAFELDTAVLCLTCV